MLSRDQKLDDIGFYTLEDNRAKHASISSPLWRCEILLTNKCNFKCPYCRGTGPDGHQSNSSLIQILDFWFSEGLKNIRFSGGEPTLHPNLNELVKRCKDNNVKRIAISTNGSARLDYYKKLIADGVNDFSISLDACCSSFGDEMAGVKGMWKRTISNIRELSKLTYVTVGIVLTDKTIHTAFDMIKFAHELGVADIRIITAAQCNNTLYNLNKINHIILKKHPILNYRISNFKNTKDVRGIKKSDCHRCHLVKDDMAVSGKYHYPCIIHLREANQPIGEIGETTRQDRVNWSNNHNTFKDHICRTNCLDVCIDYNNKCEKFGKSE